MPGMTITALRDEITNDPRAYGYAIPRAARDDSGVSALLNMVRPTINVQRKYVDASELMAAVEVSEYLAAVANNRTWFNLLVGVDRIYLTGTTRAFLAGMFGAASVTRPRLTALMDRQGSRAEELWGEDVTEQQVVFAMRPAP